MPKVFLTLVLIAGLLLLPGCSNNQAEAKCNSVKASLEKVAKQYVEERDKYYALAASSFTYLKALEAKKDVLFEAQKIALIVTNNPVCFTPEQVATWTLLYQEAEALK